MSYISKHHKEGCDSILVLFLTLDSAMQVHCVRHTSDAPTPTVSVVWQPLPAPLELSHVFQDNWPSTTFLDTLVRPPHEWVQLWDAAMYPVLKGAHFFQWKNGSEGSSVAWVFHRLFTVISTGVA